ncbi:MAG: 50S ribosomal protein L6 [Candidatus Parcubacteria bacterium]|nr:50S ribosomal protein L6 [Candidatus Parcubacteria bacterium]
MSRIGKKLITIPDGVEIKIEGSKVIAKGPKGESSLEIFPQIEITIDGKEIKTSIREAGKRSKEIRQANTLWGSSRALLNSMIKGVKEGYEKKLAIEGVGFKAAVEGNDIVLQMGFTHPVKILGKEGIKFLVEKNIITVSGIDKNLVSQTAAEIKKVKPPEPYKGKGIRYLGEIIRRKEGKRAAATTAA